MLHFAPCPLRCLTLGTKGNTVKESLERVPAVESLTSSFAKRLRFNKENANISPFHGHFKATVEYDLLNSLLRGGGGAGGTWECSHKGSS